MYPHFFITLCYFLMPKFKDDSEVNTFKINNLRTFLLLFPSYNVVLMIFMCMLFVERFAIKVNHIDQSRLIHIGNLRFTYI